MALIRAALAFCALQGASASAGCPRGDSDPACHAADPDDEVSLLQLRAPDVPQARDRGMMSPNLGGIIDEFLGIDELSKQVLPMRKGAGKDGEFEGYIPMFATHRFMKEKTDSHLKKIQKAIILVQEYTGTPKQSTDLVYDIKLIKDNLLRPRRALHSTLVIFPWFIEELVLLPSQTWDVNSTLRLPALFWSDPGQYASGGDSKHGAISPFGVFDRLVDLLQNDLASVLPNLKTIDIVGYSGGCKVATRWAFFSPFAMPNTGRARLRVAAGGCSNFLYLDARRPHESCRLATGHGGDYNCTAFSVPTACPGYNDYDKGLEAVDSDFTYVKRIVSDSAVLKSTVDQFPSKEVLFMVGKQDDCNCLDAEKFQNPTHCYHPWPLFCNDVYPDFKGYLQTTGVVGGSCSKNLQGWSRAQRFTNYMSHLRQFYAERGVQYSPHQAMHDGAHAYDEMLLSPAFYSFLGFDAV